ncbi:uncharacterized protein MELLADRAFT_66987 [Melampsora larici-populina 98AG31]|uniref:Uncharacterized protein n=1 Tax=Melampsora larici-populina (strain 98AG31 / pathotype 3-4-7) TaxID=747676 RepID=F4S1D4_MELLP|nr:uncharacterized protein MELLADRAFT_66987 [Melampsora larici-populina 98AG31]EGG01579.1 hypothetical protein MELLADRAFT_66987 [Melampsora larici-populina 98AG31]
MLLAHDLNPSSKQKSFDPSHKKALNGTTNLNNNHLQTQTAPQSPVNNTDSSLSTVTDHIDNNNRPTCNTTFTISSDLSSADTAQGPTPFGALPQSTPVLDMASPKTQISFKFDEEQRDAVALKAIGLGISVRSIKTHGDPVSSITATFFLWCS